MEKTCLIITGGEDSGNIAAEHCPDMVIACDSGYHYAEAYGIVPDLIIGDFDSAEYPKCTEIPVLRYPSEKDDTDTMLAARYAVQCGCTKVQILCGLGGRLDHAIANIQCAAFIASQGGTAEIYGKNDIITVFSGSRDFPQRKGWSLSVFSLTDRSEGVSIKGTAYEATDVELTSSFPIGVSNRCDSENAHISAKTGMLMVIQSRLKAGEHN